ncbi:Hypothetical protein D9617_18g032650 [Elsinoe fawcettii]|nr:Hypothetical protein D9617_18g032650 [Elsinoe fawcettii]
MAEVKELVGLGVSSEDDNRDALTKKLFVLLGETIKLKRVFDEAEASDDKLPEIQYSARKHAEFGEMVMQEEVTDEFLAEFGQMRGRQNAEKEVEELKVENEQLKKDKTKLEQELMKLRGSAGDGEAAEAEA